MVYWQMEARAHECNSRGRSIMEDSQSYVPHMCWAARLDHLMGADKHIDATASGLAYLTGLEDHRSRGGHVRLGARIAPLCRLRAWAGLLGYVMRCAGGRWCEEAQLSKCGAAPCNAKPSPEGECTCRGCLLWSAVGEIML